MGKSKPRVLALYTELTSLQKGHDECITDYVLRAETAAAPLKSAGETVRDSLLGYDRSSPAFLMYCPQKKIVRKVRCVRFTENFDNVDETVELLPDSVKPGEPEKPTHGKEDANVRRYPSRDHARPKYLDDYVTGEDIDDAIDDTANCTIDFC